MIGKLSALITISTRARRFRSLFDAGLTTRVSVFSNGAQGNGTLDFSLP